MAATIVRARGQSIRSALGVEAKGMPPETDVIKGFVLKAAK
jgi:hypothetical protein